jgi:Fe-S oxidoreductase
MTQGTVSPFQDAIDIVKEEGGDICKLCYQCGTCTATCPWNTVRSFMVRKTMHQAQLGLIDFENEDNWLCVTCKWCVDRCPRGVGIIDVWRSFRRSIVEMGIGGVPDSIRITQKNISSVGNPQGEDREKRNAWAADAGVKPFTKGMEVLYFGCCSNSYDPKLIRVAKATAKIMQKAGISFGIMGNEQNCCGESIRNAGAEETFKSLAQANVDNFNKLGVQKIFVSSPHCYHTIKNEYTELGGKFEVVHSSQFIAQLIKEGKIKPVKEIKKVVTLHDSCYLGRHNNVYDDPRNVLKSIPGIELVEMYNNRENGLCCGGGGGRVWAETKKGERFSDIRIGQAIDAKATILAAACPYCMAMLEDSVISMDKANAIEVKEIVELVAESM